MQEIRFKVSLDDGGVSTAGARTEASMRGIERAGTQASAAVKAFGNQTKLSAHDARLLSIQTSDIAVSLAGGQSPFLVLLQQGAQLRDQFGSTRGVFAAYASTLNVTRVAVGGVAGALAVLGLGAYQG
jgi:phage-related minor tail protein